MRRSICLWTITKKKPISTVQLAHGIHEHISETEGAISNARWITALATLGYGDVFASGAFLFLSVFLFLLLVTDTDIFAE